MELSAYCKSCEFPEKPGHVLLFSTRKGSLSLLAADAFERLKRGDVPGDAAETLAKLGYVTANAEAERAEVLGYLDEVNRVDPCVTAAVILGMGCNFACPYCYEGSLKDGSAMSEATAEALVAFLGERLRPGKRKLLLDFYGGEPLLYLDRIRQIATASRRLAEERGAEFSFTLVTNGSLLTRDVASTLVPLGLSGAKVTVDGPPEQHNRTRPFRSGKESFETILSNVQACCDVVPIALAGNFLPDTWRDFPRLLERLAASGLGPEKLGQVRFDPVMQTSDRFSSSEFRSGCSSLAEVWAVEAYLNLAEELLRRGYATRPIRPTPCMADVDGAFTVHWDGALYKCPGFAGHREFAVGDVWSGPRDHRAIYGGERWKARSECRSCEYLPLCFGGCRYLRYQREGDPSGVECQRPVFEKTLGRLLQLQALHRQRRG